MALLGDNEEFLQLGEEVEVDEVDVLDENDEETDDIEEPDDDETIPDDDEDDTGAEYDSTPVTIQAAEEEEQDENDIVDEDDEEDEDLTEYETVVEEEDDPEPLVSNVAEMPCLGAIQEGDRVMIAIVNGEPCAVGAEGASDAIVADLGVFKNLVAGSFTAQEGRIGELETNNLVVNDTLTAHTAVINNLNANYATVDFDNITNASIENLYAKSGFIDDIQIVEGHFTGKLTAVQIDAGDIKTGVLATDRLLIKGADSLYYALNVNALGQATISSLTPAEQEALKNGIRGENIIARTITADKINCTDLVAFGATIGA